MRVGLCVCNVPGADLCSVKVMKEFQKTLCEKNEVIMSRCGSVNLCYSHFRMLLKASDI